MVVDDDELLELLLGPLLAPLVLSLAVDVESDPVEVVLACWEEEYDANVDATLLMVVMGYPLLAGNDILYTDAP